MKLFKFTPLLLALMLAACATTPSSSSQTPSSLEPSSSEEVSSSSEESSSEVPSSEVPSSEVPSSSEEPSSETPSTEEPSSSEVPSSEEPEPSSEQPIAGWNEDELALIDTYAHGIDIPYLLLEGNGELYFDDYYGCLSMTGASVSKADLDAYAQLFIDAEWEVVASLEDNYLYEFSKSINTVEGERFVVVDIYALDETGYYAEQGEFWLDIYDPYLYEWDAEFVNEIVYYLTGQEISVPAFEAKYYVFNTSFISYGMAWVECYTDDDNASSVYEEDLIAAGYSIDKDEAEVDFLAYDPSGYLMISVTYYAEYGYLDITFYALEVPPEEDPDGGYSALNVMKEICYNLFEDETAYDDDGEGGYYTIVSFGEAEETEEYLTHGRNSYRISPFVFSSLRRTCYGYME